MISYQHAYSYAMLRFSRSYCIYFVLVSVLCTPGDADPSISTSTPTPCYGDVVTLVCRHPEVASNRRRYFIPIPSWRENGVGITPSTGIYSQTDTSEDLTSTTLTINITVDHFRNKSFNYSCLLALAENGLPTGEVETSENVTLDPVEPHPPSSIVNIDCSIPTSIAFNWTHIPVECYKNRISYYVSWVNIDNNTENGSDVTGEHMYNITGLVANSNYTISVWTVVDGNVQSTAVTRDVTTGKPLVLPKTPSLSACHNRNFTLYCDVSPLHILQFSGIYWIFNSHRILSGFDTFAVSNNSRELVILNVTASTAGDYGCGIELNSGTLVEGDTYSMHPLDSPKEPHNIALTSGVAGISVSWEHDRSCFEDHVFAFIVSWQKGCTCDHSELIMNITVSGTTFNIRNLEPDTTYKICVSAVSISDRQEKSEMKCLHTKTLKLVSISNTGGLSTGLIAGIVVVCVVVILLTFLAGCGVGVIVLVVYQKKSKQSTRSTEGTFDEDKKNSPIPSYVNVELDDGSVPMTTNPSYLQVERMTEGPKPLYGNL